MSIKDFLDRTFFSDTRSKGDLYGNTLRKTLKFNSFGTKRVFSAIVLTRPIFLADADITAAGGGGSPFRPKKDVSRLTKFAFKGRILDHPSPHDYLPDPCNSEIASNAEKAQRIANLHTTFISSDDYTKTSNYLPRVGDKVRVELTDNIFSYNLQFGAFLAIQDNKAVVEVDPLNREDCINIREIFADPDKPWLIPARSTVGGAPALKVGAPAPGAPAPANIQVSAPPPSTGPVHTGTQNTGTSILTLGHGTMVWPWKESMRNKKITLVVFYHGLLAGKPKDYLQKYLIEGASYRGPGKDGLIPAFNELGKTLENSLFLVPKKYDVGISFVIGDIEKLKTEYGITIDRYILAAHSAGARGALGALNRKSIAWDSVFWADPDPSAIRKAFEANPNSQNYKSNLMYYRLSNWGSPPADYAANNFPKLAASIQAYGGAATSIEQDHFPICTTVIKLIGTKIN